jgi:hypothetical protein
MGSAAVADLVARTDHEVTIGDIRLDVAAALLRKLDAPERVVRVDVDDPASLAAALAGTETVLNATYMRVGCVPPMRRRGRRPSTSARTTWTASSPAPRAPPWRRLPDRPGCVALTNILARLGADRPTASTIRMYSSHASMDLAGHRGDPLDASTDVSSWRRRARRRALPGAGASHSRPGEQEVHLVPHPEPVTLRSMDAANVVFKVGYPADETRASGSCSSWASIARRIRGRRGPVSPRRFAAYIGSRGIGPDERSANVKHAG